jgi:hypothetical protein
LEFFVSVGSPLASETPDVKTAVAALTVVAVTPPDPNMIVGIPYMYIQDSLKRIQHTNIALRQAVYNEEI